MIKSIFFAFLLFFVGDLCAYYSEDWPEKRTYYIGRIGHSSVQFDLSWDGDDISGYYILDNCEREVTNGIQIARFAREIELLCEDFLLKLTKEEFGTGYSGEAIYDGSISKNIYIEPVAEYVLRSIKFPPMVEVNCYYPVFYPVNEVAAQVNIKIQEDMAEIDLFFNEGINSFSCDSEYSYFRWSLKKKFQIKHYSSYLISVISKYRQNTGGASGQLGTNGINIVVDSNKAKVLDVKDILNDESYMLQISKMVRSKLVKKVSLGYLSETDEELIEKIEHFSLSHSGISVHFAKYAVDCGMAGEFEVTLSWDEVEDIVRKNDVLRDFYYNTAFKCPCEGKVKAEDYK